MAHVKRNVEGAHAAQRRTVAHVELQHTTVAVGGVAHAELVSAIGNRRQTEGKVEGTLTVELVALIVAPAIALTGQIVETSVFAIIDDQVAEETIRTADIVATKVTIGTGLTVVEGIDLSVGNHTEIVGHHLFEESGVVETQTLVEHAMGHICIVNKDVTDGMDVSVERLDVVVLHLNAVAHDGGHGIGTHLADSVGQRVVGDPTVDEALSTDTANLQQGVGKHGLVVLEERHFGNLVESTDELVERHLALQDVIAQEHVQRIVGFSVVVARADGDAVVAVVIVPTGTSIGAVGIDLVGKLGQVVHVVDTLGTKCLVGLCKDSIAHDALLGNVELVLASHIGLIEVSALLGCQ